MYTAFNRALTKKVMACADSIPITFRGFHLVTTKSGKSVVDVVVPVLKQLVGRAARHRILVHAGSDWDILRLVKPYGLAPRNISSAIGGEYTKENFVKWMKERRKTEQDRWNTTEES